MVIGFGFAPDPVRAQRIDARMHHELGKSVAHVCEASRGVLSFDRDALDRLCAKLASGEAVGPGVFARYYELVEAIEAGDAGRGARLLSELGRADIAGTAPAITALGDPALADGDIYLRTMNEGESDLRLIEPAPEAAAAFRKRLGDGMALLARSSPAIAAELRAIVRQIVICGSDAAMPMQFDGGSSLRLWGALFLNAGFHPDEVAVVEVLAHESAHSLLFGFCIDEPLVRNDPDARYPSPLRIDPRPMEGIYHATYVSARMHLAMSAIADDAALPREWRERASAAAALDSRNFASGHEVVVAHGELSVAGAALMASAKAYMDAAA